MRLAAFVLAGVIIGVASAWLRARTHVTSVDPAPRLARIEPKPSDQVASPASASSAYRAPVPQRELSPSDARYDPVARLAEEPDLTLKEIFEGEPRDPGFAPVLEHRVQAAVDVIARELLLGDEILKVHVECRTLSCYTTIQVPQADVREVYEQINGILLGDFQMPDMSKNAGVELGEVTIYNIYRSATRNDTYYKKFVEEAMQAPLELVKQRSARRRSAGQDGPDAGRSGDAP
jgi:hypothetical protein